MAKRISIANQKGGVGKSTSTYALAAAKAAKIGKTLGPVLMIDMDPQYSLTEYCGMIPDSPEFNDMNTVKLFQRQTDPLDCVFEVEPLAEKYDLFIVPSTQDLAITALDLHKNPSLIKVFKGKIDKLAKYFSYIFFDCPPSLDMLLTSALISSDSVIVPVKPERLSYAGLKLIFNTIEGVQSENNELNNPKLKVEGVLATMYRSNVKEHNEHIGLLAANNNLLGIIPMSAMVTKEVEFGLPVVIAHPTSKPAIEYIKVANKI